MIDALSALSLYRQLEGLEEVLKNADANVTSQWFVAYTNQASFQSHFGANYGAMR